MEKEKLKLLLTLSWKEENCSSGLRNNWSKEIPSLDQSAITALIVNDFFGGKIMRCITTSGSHYYNLIDNKLIDLTVEQFSGEVPQYENTRKRYEILLYNLKQVIRQSQGKKFKLININGQEYLSDIPGTLGGNKKLKIYGRLDCPSAKRWIDKGKYISNRVFFENEAVAIATGYRPCAICMPNEYKEWKKNKTKLLNNVKY